MPIFEELRKRMFSVMGVKVCSFEDLEKLEIDSIDSVCLSSASSMTSHQSSTEQDLMSTNYDALKSNAQQKVLKILKFIKKLNQFNSFKKQEQMKLPAFMDLLRDKQYTHVSMCMLDKFIKTFKIVPKPHLLHYYIYFLHYASYYHHVRATTDVIDKDMKQKHLSYLVYLKLQLNYLHYIIYESRNKDISL